MGKGVSQQTYAITLKIAEVDEVMSARDEGASPKVREVHPEVCFWALNGNQATRCGKKTSQGYDERRNLLQRVDPQATDIIDKAMGKYLRKHVAKDDILDALVAAVTAREGGLAGLATIPSHPPSDSRGLPMEMVYLGQGSPE